MIITKHYHKGLKNVVVTAGNSRDTNDVQTKAAQMSERLIFN